MPSSAKAVSFKLGTSSKKRQPSCKLECQVVLLDNTTFTATFEKKSAKGQELFDRVCAYLGVTSKDFFGLQYTGWEDGELNCLELNEEIRTQRSKPYHFQFAIKFYPRNPRKLDHAARELLCLQIKHFLTRGKFINPVPVRRHAVLDGYFAQVVLGDFNPHTHTRGYLERQLGRFFEPPNGINSDEEISELKYGSMVCRCHISHSGLPRDEAVLAFLELASELPFYGITLQNGATDTNGNQVMLGIYEKGILVYSVSSIGEPGVLQLEFAWHEIVAMHQQNRKFHVLYYSEEKKDGSNYTFRFHGHYGHKTAARTLKIALEHQKMFYQPDKKVHRRSRSFAEADSIARAPQPFDRADKKYATTDVRRSKSSFGKIKSSLKSKLPRRHKSRDYEEAKPEEMRPVQPISGPDSPGSAGYDCRPESGFDCPDQSSRNESKLSTITYV